jgi:hypothetical protein
MVELCGGSIDMRMSTTAPRGRAPPARSTPVSQAGETSLGSVIRVSGMGCLLVAANDLWRE